MIILILVLTQNKRRWNLTIKDTQITPDKEIFHWWILFFCIIWIQIRHSFICLVPCLCVSYVNSIGSLRWKMVNGFI